MIFFLHILSNSIIPIFTIVLVGFILSKNFDLNLSTLSKLNFYIFIPSFTFYNLYTADIPKGMFKVVIFALSLLILNNLMAFIAARALKFDKGLCAAFKNSIMFYNSGNIGIPLITLVFSSYPFLINGSTPYLNLALTTQIIILVVQDLFTNTVGFINASNSNFHWTISLKKIFKMPTIYTVPLALILRFVPYDFTKVPLWPALIYIKNGLVGIALLTLGIQLSQTQFTLKNKAVYLSVLLRLLGGPMIAFLLIYILGIEGIIAQALLISSSVSTAVSTALIAVECNNYPGFSYQTVMLSTLLSGITLTAIIYLANLLFPII